MGALRGQYEKAELARRLSEANLEVREASRAKSEFLANMSHELRTPLNAIIGFSEIMAREILGPVGQPRYRDYAHDIQDSGKHLLGVINDILDLSRIEAGRMTLVEDEVDLAAVISGCVRLLSYRAATAGVAIVPDFDKETCRIRADEGRIRQIGFNLLANAIKFTPQGGEVRIAIAPNHDGEVELTVADTGIGMRPEDIPVAMTPFQQVQTGGVRNIGGTGLGLPLTKTLVELHGGRLAISSALGEGTTVSAVFPRERVMSATG
jgi:signal transduction histidine kinase